MQSDDMNDVPAMDVSLDISDDVQDEDEEMLGDRDPFEGDEDDIRSRQKLNSVATISSLRFQPLSSSRFVKVRQGSMPRFLWW